MKINLRQTEGVDPRLAAKRFRRMPAEFKSIMRKYQRAEFTPIWREEIAAASAAQKPVYGALFKTGNTVQVGASINLKAANSRKTTSSGADRGDLAIFYEFGTTNPNLLVRYPRRSKNGGTHSVTRHVSRGLPPRRRNGYVTGPALAKFIKRAAKLHAQTLTKTVYEILGEA